MNVIYEGKLDAVRVRGVDFPKGEIVDLTGNPSLAAKMLAWPDVSEVNAAPALADPEPDVSEVNAAPALADPEPDVTERDELTAKLEAAGVDVDGRWGMDTLREKVGQIGG